MNHKNELIAYRRGKASSTLRDAELLYGEKSYASAVNRIYYALFYEVTALLLTIDLSSSKHSGIRSLFNEHFVKTGIISVEYGKFFSMLYDTRQKGDYGDFVIFEPDAVLNWLSRAALFLKVLEEKFEE